MRQGSRLATGLVRSSQTDIAALPMASPSSTSDYGEARQQADADEFARLVQLYRPVVLGHCLRHSRNALDAEDAAQETFLRAWRAFDRFDHDRPFLPWIRTIATHVCIDSGRRATRSPESPNAREVFTRIADDSATPCDDVDTIVVRDALDRISARHRKMLQLREFEGLSYEEIAHHEQIELNAVKVLLWRARQSLRRELVSGGSQRNWAAFLLPAGVLRRLVRIGQAVTRPRQIAAGASGLVEQFAPLGMVTAVTGTAAFITLTVINLSAPPAATVPVAPTPVIAIAAATATRPVIDVAYHRWISSARTSPVLDLVAAMESDATDETDSSTPADQSSGDTTDPTTTDGSSDSTSSPATDPTTTDPTASTLSTTVAGIQSPTTTTTTGNSGGGGSGQPPAGGNNAPSGSTGAGKSAGAGSGSRGNGSTSAGNGKSGQGGGTASNGNAVGAGNGNTVGTDNGVGNGGVNNSGTVGSGTTGGGNTVGTDNGVGNGGVNNSGTVPTGNSGTTGGGNTVGTDNGVGNGGVNNAGGLPATTNSNPNADAADPNANVNSGAGKSAAAANKTGH